MTDMDKYSFDTQCFWCDFYSQTTNFIISKHERANFHVHKVSWFKFFRWRSRSMSWFRTTPTHRECLPKTALNEVLRHELTWEKNEKIRVRMRMVWVDGKEGKSHWDNKSNWLAIKIIGSNFISLSRYLRSGEVRTVMVEARGYSGASDDYYEVNPTLDPENIAAGVLFML